jgi:hypothetical protein
MNKPVIFVLAAGAAAFAYFMQGGEKELEYRETYSSINDTRHYYFDQGVMREVSQSVPEPYVESLLEEMGIESSLQGYQRELGSRTVTWNGYNNGGRLIAHIDSCDEKSGNCISRITIVPSSRERMISLAEGSSRRKFIEKNDFGDEWPLIVDYGVVSCQAPGAVYFSTEDNRRFPVNGLAISGDTSGNDIREIWRDHPSPHTPKYPIGPVLNTGLGICD